MMQSFEVTFEASGKAWVATVVQTAGVPVLPAGRAVFNGKSLAAVEEKASMHLSGLHLEDWVTSYDFAPVLGPDLAHRVVEAQDAIEEAEAAEHRKVRLAYGAIKSLSGAGFTMRDISVLLGESKTVIQQIVREGKGLEAADFLCIDGPAWYSPKHADVGLSPGAAIAIDVAYEVMPETERTAPHEVALVERLPDRFLRRYDRDFMAKFSSVMESVYDAITRVDVANMSSTPAEEIALAVLIAAARHHLTLVLTLGPPAGSLAALRTDVQSLLAFREAVARDLNVDFLWGHQNDGCEDDPRTIRRPGIDKPLQFENWFKQYRAGGK
jgi:hypothetical protein